MSSKNPIDRQREPLTYGCYVGSGLAYQGAVCTTLSGKICLPWTRSESRYSPENFPSLRTAWNYCRNPDSHNKTRPWCYTAPGEDEYCNVRPCPEGMYPHLQTISEGVVAKYWRNLPSHWQYAAMGGAGILSLLILLLMCMCCCRRRGKERATDAKKSCWIQSNGAFEMSCLPSPPHSQPSPIDLPPEIPCDRLEFVELLGEGQFGKVMKGNLHGHGISDDAEPLQVAIKILKEDSLPRHRADFTKEVRYAARLRHPNVVQLIGVCSVNDAPVAAIFECMVYGDLHELLRLRAPVPNVYVNEPTADKERIASDHDDFLHIVTQIAAGMEYLVGMGYVHRDVAARNILVTYRRVIKIADFGLMRDCYEKDYYRMQHRTMVPVRWMSLEALVYGKFSEASDVWAFGVTVWEIYSYGRRPHECFDNQQVIELIRSRILLQCPVNCPTYIYSLMVECWLENPTRRPRFAELHSRLTVWSMISSSAQSSTVSVIDAHGQSVV